MQYLFAYHFSTLANHGRARTYRPLCYSWRQMTSYGMGRWKVVCYWCKCPCGNNQYHDEGVVGNTSNKLKDQPPSVRVAHQEHAFANVADFVSTRHAIQEKAVNSKMLTMIGQNKHFRTILRR